MTHKGWVEWGVSFLKRLGDANRMRRRMRVMLLVGTAVCVLCISPTTAQTTGGAAFEMFTSGTDTIAIAGDATRIGETGVVGHAWATSGQNFGVRGVTNSTSGIGVNGRASATTGQNFGVRGITLSAGDAATGAPAYGVFGHATALSGASIGAGGRSDSSTGTGVFGHATALSGPTTGTGGQSDSSTGTGVFGHAIALSGPTIGTGGQSDSPTGTGVFGYATATSCPTLISPPAGFGQTCIGVAGIASATSGTAAGVFGTTSSSGAGVVGQATGRGGSGVLGAATVSGATAGQFTAALGANAGNFEGGPVIMGCPTHPCLVTQGALVSDNMSVNGSVNVTNGSVTVTCSGPPPPLGVPSPCLSVNGTNLQVPDLAEDMPVARPVSPGDVVVLTPGQGYGVAPATQAYDPLVAGIVSTAPRMVFGIGQRNAAPVAMVGVVKAKATAVNGPIKFGDLLTTSPVPGRLMRCDSALRCVGAIVGKALEPLPKGEQSILVLLWRQ